MLIHECVVENELEVSCANRPLPKLQLCTFGLSNVARCYLISNVVQVYDVAIFGCIFFAGELKLFSYAARCTWAYKYTKGKINMHIDISYHFPFCKPFFTATTLHSVHSIQTCHNHFISNVRD